MPTPKFILSLREKIGHDLLWMPGVSAVLLDAEDRVLLTHRVNDGTWALVGGILEPGEQPAIGIQREIFEETGVEAAVETLVNVESLPPAAYSNGDQVQYIDLCFRCRYVSGEPRVNDDESLAVAWYSVSDLPSSMVDRDLELIAQALKRDPVTQFVPAPQSLHNQSQS